MPPWSRSFFTLFLSSFHAAVPVSIETRLVSAEKNVEKTLGYKTGLADEGFGISIRGPLWLSSMGGSKRLRYVNEYENSR